MKWGLKIKMGSHIQSWHIKTIISSIEVRGSHEHHPECEHHPDSNYIFLHDFAGCHYSKQTVITSINIVYTLFICTIPGR